MTTSASLTISAIPPRRRMTSLSSSSLRSRASYLDICYDKSSDILVKVGSGCYCLMALDRQSTPWLSIVFTSPRRTMVHGITYQSTLPETVSRHPPWLFRRFLPLSFLRDHFFSWLSPVSVMSHSFAIFKETWRWALVTSKLEKYLKHSRNMYVTKLTKSVINYPHLANNSKGT